MKFYFILGFFYI